MANEPHSSVVVVQLEADSMSSVEPLISCHLALVSSQLVSNGIIEHSISTTFSSLPVTATIPVTSPELINGDLRPEIKNCYRISDNVNITVPYEMLSTTSKRSTTFQILKMQLHIRDFQATSRTDPIHPTIMQLSDQQHTPICIGATRYIWMIAVIIVTRMLTKKLVRANSVNFSQH